MGSPNLPPPSALVGAETRRRKARRKELEGCVASDANSTASQQMEAKDHLGSSDAEVSFNHSHLNLNETTHNYKAFMLIFCFHFLLGKTSG